MATKWYQEDDRGTKYHDQRAKTPLCICFIYFCKKWNGKFYTGEVVNCGFEGEKKTYKIYYAEDNDREIQNEELLLDIVVKNEIKMDADNYVWSFKYLALIWHSIIL